MLHLYHKCSENGKNREFIFMNINFKEQYSGGSGGSYGEVGEGNRVLILSNRKMNRSIKVEEIT